jgi:site-specific DNA-cytosine methylase
MSFPNANKLEYARTIRLGGGKSLDNKHTWDTYMIDGKIRRLTPVECERLMGWPDDWTRWGINDKGEKVEMSDSQRYKMCGNGVVSAVVREVYKITANPLL